MNNVAMAVSYKYSPRFWYFGMAGCRILPISWPNTIKSVGTQPEFRSHRVVHERTLHLSTP